MAESRHLERRRTSLLSSLERAGQFLTTYEAERDRLEVAPRLENLDGIWRELDELQAELEASEESSEGMSLNNGIRAKFEGQFYRIKAGLISKLPPSIPDAGTSSVVSSSLKGLKLPTITLPEFNGDYKEWLTFHDTFHALIHVNRDVPAIQKFHYFKSAVTGEAAQVIESFAISATSYPLAWQVLVSRYANEYLLKKRHLQAMMEIQRVKRETASTLHGIVDDFERHTKILRQLGEPVDAWSTMLEHLLCVRLPDETLKEWEVHASTTENPSYAALIEFLLRRIRVLESISVNHVNQAGSQYAASTHVSVSQRSSHIRSTSSDAVENFSIKCYACEQHHPLVKCIKFGRMSATDRLSLVNINRLCLNCFRSDHFSRNCPSKYTCRFCKRRHHSLLHSGFGDNYSQRSASASTNVHSTTTGERSSTQVVSAASAIPVNVNSSLPHKKTEKGMFMLTAVVVVTDRYGQEHFARALLDSASQPNLITERMAQILRLKRNKTKIVVQGVGEQCQNVRESMQVNVSSRKEDFTVNAEFLILQKITSDLPMHSVAIDQWNIPSNLFLADPQFFKRAPIDMILGIEHFFSFFRTVARVQLSKSLPMLVESVFGWLVSGSTQLSSTTEQHSPSKIVAVSLCSLEDSIERFWKVEELQTRSDYSLEEKHCEELFSSSTTRTVDGRYIVRLPRRATFDELIGNSKSTALRRVHVLERKLEQNPELKED
ncbi:uncharacterized protein LOC128745815 [Sabethes cyaneus]|uniref:uncharacterized protein LOC128745815 n=1 Tax=Sabethes cyaneus TaxID=53552 RepID=UPI00237E4262|nr:uncharacterized protein LOC128745815 [Sabethes cyaneus]